MTDVAATMGRPLLGKPRPAERDRERLGRGGLRERLVGGRRYLEQLLTPRPPHGDLHAEECATKHVVAAAESPEGRGTEARGVRDRLAKGGYRGSDLLDSGGGYLRSEAFPCDDSDR